MKDAINKFYIQTKIPFDLILLAKISAPYHYPRMTYEDMLDFLTVGPSTTQCFKFEVVKYENKPIEHITRLLEPAPPNGQKHGEILVLDLISAKLLLQNMSKEAQQHEANEIQGR